MNQKLELHWHNTIGFKFNPSDWNGDCNVILTLETVGEILWIHQVKENASWFIWNFSFKFDVESCPMPRLDSRPLEIPIDSIGLFHLHLRET